MKPFTILPLDLLRDPTDPQRVQWERETTRWVELPDWIAQQAPPTIATHCECETLHKGPYLEERPGPSPGDIIPVIHAERRQYCMGQMKVAVWARRCPRCDTIYWKELLLA
jgi:hypothetical protein